MQRSSSAFCVRPMPMPAYPHNPASATGSAMLGLRQQRPNTTSTSVLTSQYSCTIAQQCLWLLLPGALTLHSALNSAMLLQGKYRGYALLQSIEPARLSANPLREGCSSSCNCCCSWLDFQPPARVPAGLCCEHSAMCPPTCSCTTVHAPASKSKQVCPTKHGTCSPESEPLVPSPPLCPCGRKPHFLYGYLWLHLRNPCASRKKLRCASCAAVEPGITGAFARARSSHVNTLMATALPLKVPR